MEEKEKEKRKIQVVLRSGSPLLKIVVAVLIVFSMAALIALRWVSSGIQAQTENMRDEAAAYEQKNEDLEEKIGEVGSVQSVQDIAEEELGLVDPDTVVVTPTE